MWAKFLKEHIIAYTIEEGLFCQDFPYTIGTKTILTCYGLFERKYKYMGRRFIQFCKKSTERYHLYISKIITPIYHIYIEYGLYNLAYKKLWLFYMKIDS